jgi:hypothetical protein
MELGEREERSKAAMVDYHGTQFLQSIFWRRFFYHE